MSEVRIRFTGLDDSIGYLLRRTFKMAVPLMDRLFVGEELSFTQWVALMQLKGGKIDTPGALARCLDHDSGATTRMIDQLEERGLLSRRRSASDRRVTRLALSEAGDAAAGRLIPKVEMFWTGLFADFAMEEVDMFRRLLQRLAASLDAAMARENDI